MASRNTPVTSPGWSTTDDAHDACPVRDVLQRIGDKWSVLVVVQLAERPHRFNELLRGTDQLSQRMLTRTLRLLERDGLVHRDVRHTRPPQVTYSLTPLGDSLTKPLALLTRWAQDHRNDLRLARKDFDARELR